MRTVRSSARFDASDSAARYEYYLIVRLSDGEVAVDMDETGVRNCCAADRGLHAEV